MAKNRTSQALCPARVGESTDPMKRKRGMAETGRREERKGAPARSSATCDAHFWAKLLGGTRLGSTIRGQEVQGFRARWGGDKGGGPLAGEGRKELTGEKGRV